jgi:mRNA interferase MazF
MKRGEIYYILKNSSEECGSEQASGRPAIIVSNDKNNEHSEVVEVVFLTTQPKTDLPTHIDIRTTKRNSIALCEQINSVSKLRIGEYFGECSAYEMQLIDIALSISLGLGDNSEKQSLPEPSISIPKPTPEFERVIAERDIYKNLYEDLLNKCISK